MSFRVEHAAVGELGQEQTRKERLPSRGGSGRCPSTSDASHSFHISTPLLSHLTWHKEMGALAEGRSVALVAVCDTGPWSHVCSVKANTILDVRYMFNNTLIHGLTELDSEGSRCICWPSPRFLSSGRRLDRWSSSSAGLACSGPQRCGRCAAGVFHITIRICRAHGFGPSDDHCIISMLRTLERAVPVERSGRLFMNLTGDVNIAVHGEVRAVVDWRRDFTTK